MHRDAVINTMRRAMAHEQWATAIQIAQQWRENGGRHWSISLNLAICLLRNRQANTDQLSALATEALQLSQHHPMARLGCTELTIGMGLHEQALSLLDSLKGFRLPTPAPWSAVQLRIKALSALGRSEEALAELERWPVHERGLHWQMTAAERLLQLNAWPEAEAIYRSILAAQPCQQQAHHNLSLTLLSQQQWSEGWQEYEWRPANPRREQPGQLPPLPQLEQLSRTTVMVVDELGIGDQIMLARYLPTLAQACRRLIIQPAQRLSNLLRRSLPDDIEIIEADNVPQHHRNDTSPLVIGFGSLPLLCWEADGFGQLNDPWMLHPDQDRTQHWRQQLQRISPTKCTVGIGWLGGSSGAEHRERSLSAADLKLFHQHHNITGVDLQFLPPTWEHLRQERASSLHTLLASPGQNLDETAALIASLDHIITTRQTVAHLAGAIGKSATVLVPKRQEWRYSCSEECWHWYPNTICVHQHVRGDWQPELNQFIASLNLQQTEQITRKGN